jgi:hypothetical protein
LSIGANAIVNTTAMFVGNSTVNAIHTSAAYSLANSTVSSNLATGQLSIGANVIANTTTLFVGNSTVNATHTSALLQVANSTATANLSAIDLKVGISTVNTIQMSVGANVYANATTMFVGNSTINSSHTSTQLSFVNATATATVNATNYSGTANNASNFNGQAASFYANAQNITTGTLASARISGAYTGITQVGTLAGVAVSGNSNFDSGVLFVDGTNNRVGVNTTSPSITLQIAANDAVLLPLGTTLQRPTGSNGMIRFNTDTATFEGFANGSWGTIAGSGAGGYYKGNLGPVGNTNNKANLYRINSNTQSNNVTIAAGENALTAGPMTIQSGFSLIIEEGGRAVIV